MAEAADRGEIFGINVYEAVVHLVKHEKKPPTLPETPETASPAEDTRAQVTILPSGFLRRKGGGGSAPSNNKSISLSLSGKPSSPLSGPRALVLLEDVCRNPDASIASMVRKQLATKGVGASSDDKHSAATKGEDPGEVKHGPPPPAAAAARKMAPQVKGVDGEDRTTSSPSSASTPTSGKNIFEKFMPGRRSPRKRSNSPRCNKPGSVQDDSSDARSSSEEKQQMSIATAVKALRGLSGKMPDTGKPRTSRKDRETARDSAKTSRNASPSSSASPKCSPQRQSPRRLPEKMSPPVTAAIQKSPKARKSASSSSAGSDNGESPSSAGRRVRSPRRGGELVTSGVSPVDNSWSSTEHSPSEGDKKSNKGGKPSAAGNRHTGEGSPEEHTIHILSSTSRGSKVIQVERQRSPVCAARKLFVSGQSDSPDSGKRTGLTTSSKTLKRSSSSSSCEKDVRENSDPKPGASAVWATASSSSVSCFASPSSKSRKPGLSGPDASLLCAMLVGGSEVTQSYEKSREQTVTQGSKAMSECSDSVDWKASESNSFLDCNDSFFDDDVTGDVPEEKPYELPVLSQLPPLNKPNIAVLDVVVETGSPQSRHQTLPPGHGKRTSSLLQLISRVKERLPEDSEACQAVISDAQKLLNSENEECDSDAPVSQAVVQDEGQDQTQAESAEMRRDEDSLMRSCSSVCDGAADTAVSKDSRVEEGVPCTEAGGGTVGEQTQDCSECSMEDRGGPLEEEEDFPNSPSSLGELDTTQMTKAATQAVQNLVKDGGDHPSPERPTQDLSQNHNSPPATKKPQPSALGLSWQSSSGGQGTASESEDTSRPGPSSGRAGSSLSSQSRSFFSRIASPSRQRWKPKVDRTSDNERPGWSKWHPVVSPLPISVLGLLEKSSSTSKLSAFVSKDLDRYLNQSSNRCVVPASQESRLAWMLREEGHVRDYHQLQRQISREEGEGGERPGEEGGGGKSDEEEEEEEDDKDSEAARKLDPDFDEVNGLVFVSFPSEMAVKAHMELETSRQWDGGPTAYLNMAKFHAFEESRRKEGKVRRESQGLRGQHMKWRRYQRLYRNELRRLYDVSNKDAPWPLSKLPEKTSDIHKIKNWKSKFGDMKSEDMEALELLGEDEERIKRKRKTYVFSSKKKKVKRTSGPQESFVLKKERMDEDRDDEEDEEDDDDKDHREEEDGYGVPIPIDQDQYMDDVNSSIEELRLKEKGLKQSKGIFSRFKMGPEERHIFKKLGGWNSRFRRFRRMPQEMKDGDGPIRLPRKRAPKKDRFRQRFELKVVNIGLALSALSALRTDTGSEGWRRPVNDAICQGNSVKVEAGDFVDLTAGDGALSDVNSKKLHCDKPGCRYGCICHLCLPSAESDETDQTQTPVPSRRTCDKEYCRLGCICDSLEKSGTSMSHTQPALQDAGSVLQSGSLAAGCTKPGCVEKCVCLPSVKGQSRPGEKNPQPLTSIKQDTPPAHHHHHTVKGGSGSGGDGCDQALESSGDELPTLEKTAPRRQRSTDRYSNLPRRQTSYRIAKNLDAVSRKAMMMWEMSEVYSEQTTNRRKKVPESISPAVTSYSSSVPPSTAITSSLPSPLSSSLSAVFTTTSTSTPHSSTITAAMSVNTLSTVVTSPSTPSTAPPALLQQSPPINTVKTSLPQVSTAPQSSSSASRPIQDMSPVVVSDDEGKPDVQTKEPGTGCAQQPRRVRRKKKVSSGVDGEGEDTTGGKAKVSGSSPISLCSSSPEFPTDTTTTTTTRPPPPSPPRQWHSTLICLRANNPTPVSVSDDVMEEDEIKLVEMIFNCPWDRCKEQILKAITSNVKRGMYPEPRVQVIGDFRVEILPKAARPSAIPQELRSKLPKFMFPVRVRVTEVSQQQLLPRAKDHGEGLKSVTLEGSKLAVPAAPSGSIAGDGEPGMVGVGRGGAEVLKLPQSSVTSRLMPTATASSLPLPPLGLVPVSVQGVVPRSAALQLGGSPSLTTPLLSSAPQGGPGVGSDGPSGTMGISGLSRLQITHNTSASHVASPSLALQQHFKIQKKELCSPDEVTPAGEKKKKRKKKKKKALGDDSLVPDLSNLSVSPRKAPTSTPTTLLTSTPTPTPLAASTPTVRLARPRSSAKDPGVSPVRPTQMTPPAFPLPPTPPQPIGRLLRPLSTALRPQMLGFPSLPAHLSNVKFLQLPGQNNLLQIVPASALGLKHLDNKNVPNFVAVPVSLTSIAQQNLAAAAGKKLVKAQEEPPHPKSPASATPQGGSHLSTPAGSMSSSEKKAACGGGGGDSKSPGVSGSAVAGDSSQEVPPVKKKKKRKKKKPLEGDEPDGEGRRAKKSSSSSGPFVAAPLLVAGSPTPVMSSVGSFPVHSMTNVHSMTSTHGVTDTHGVINTHSVTNTHGVTSTHGMTDTHGVTNTHSVTNTHGVTDTHGVTNTHSMTTAYSVTSTLGVTNTHGMTNTHGVNGVNNTHSSTTDTHSTPLSAPCSSPPSSTGPLLSLPAQGFTKTLCAHHHSLPLTVPPPQHGATHPQPLTLTLADSHFAAAPLDSVAPAGGVSTMSLSHGGGGEGASNSKPASGISVSGVDSPAQRAAATTTTTTSSSSFLAPSPLSGASVDGMVRSSPLADRLPPAPSVLFPFPWGEEGQTTGGSDDDSKGSWLEHVELSSSEEDGLDVGVEPPAPEDLTSHLLTAKTVQENMMIRRDCERRRRDDLRDGFRTLKTVLNVEGATLPKILSQRKILNKTVSLIHFHRRVLSLKKEALEKCRERQIKLVKKLQKLIDGMRAHGVTESSIKQVLSQVPADHLHPFSIPCPTATTPTLQHPGPSLSAPLHHVSAQGDRCQDNEDVRGARRQCESAPPASGLGHDSSLKTWTQAVVGRLGPGSVPGSAAAGEGMAMGSSSGGGRGDRGTGCGGSSGVEGQHGEGVWGQQGRLWKGWEGGENGQRGVGREEDRWVLCSDTTPTLNPTYTPDTSLSADHQHAGEVGERGDGGRRTAGSCEGEGWRTSDAVGGGGRLQPVTPERGRTSSDRIQGDPPCAAVAPGGNDDDRHCGGQAGPERGSDSDGLGLVITSVTSLRNLTSTLQHVGNVSKVADSQKTATTAHKS
ncbi:uncharacterized protein LOC143284263 [Babylonia areolata]|uniref:uncharacterized protein LOC143284263 n=1 Tax=Babylonia areolata TaxID=304850 RepID=UPI003FD043B9